MGNPQAVDIQAARDALREDTVGTWRLCKGDMLLAHEPIFHWYEHSCIGCEARKLEEFSKIADDERRGLLEELHDANEKLIEIKEALEKAESQIESLKEKIDRDDIEITALQEELHDVNEQLRDIKTTNAWRHL